MSFGDHFEWAFLVADDVQVPLLVLFYAVRLSRDYGRVWKGLRVGLGFYTAWVILIGFALDHGASRILLEQLGEWGNPLPVEIATHLRSVYFRHEDDLVYGAAVVALPLWFLPTAIAWGLRRRAVRPTAAPPPMRSWKWPATSGFALLLSQQVCLMTRRDPYLGAGHFLTDTMALPGVWLIGVAMVRWVKARLRSWPGYARNLAATFAVLLSPFAAFLIGAAALEVDMAWLSLTLGSKYQRWQATVVERPVASPPTLPGTFTELADEWIAWLNNHRDNKGQSRCLNTYSSGDRPHLPQPMEQVGSTACDDWVASQWDGVQGMLLATHAAASAVTACRPEPMDNEFWAFNVSSRAAALRVGTLVRAGRVTEAVGICRDMIALEREVSFASGTLGLAARRWIAYDALLACPTVFERSPIETRRAALAEIDSVENAVGRLPAAVERDDVCVFQYRGMPNFSAAPLDRSQVSRTTSSSTNSIGSCRKQPR